MRWRLLVLVVIGMAGWGLPSSGRAEDWPTYGHDNRRSHVTGETLALPLRLAWAYRSPLPPRTAWTGPAKWDAYASNEGLQSMRNFDPAFFVTAVGDRVFFGSSADNAAHCLDAETGAERWVAFAESPVRLPPSWHEGKVYFGSDDGYAYCVEATTGEQVWRFRPVPDSERIASNGSLMSRWPVRTGVMVDGDLAFFGNSLFPWSTSYLCAVDAGTGEKVYVEERQGITLQGALLASADRLYAPQGRSVPLVFAKSTGSALGNVAGSGGVYCLLTEEEQFVSMPNNQKSKDEVVKITDPENRESLLTVNGANRMLVSGRMAIFHQRTELKVIDRFAAIEAQREIGEREKRVRELEKQTKAESGNAASLKAEAVRLRSELPEWKARREAAERWRLPLPVPSALILAGDHLVVGGEGKVIAVSVESGDIAWEAEVEGRVYGLVVANGRLFASSDRGIIACFASGR